MLQFTVKHTPNLKQFLRGYMEYADEIYTHASNVERMFSVQ